MDIQLLLGNMRGYSTTLGEFVDIQLLIVVENPSGYSNNIEPLTP